MVNKGGCLKGRVGEKPKGGCKVGKKTVTTTKKTNNKKANTTTTTKTTKTTTTKKNKGGCKVGRVGERPKGGCKIGKKTAGKATTRPVPAPRRPVPAPRRPVPAPRRPPIKLTVPAPRPVPGVKDEALAKLATMRADRQRLENMTSIANQEIAKLKSGQKKRKTRSDKGVKKKTKADFQSIYGLNKDNKRI